VKSPFLFTSRPGVTSLTARIFSSATVRFWHLVMWKEVGLAGCYMFQSVHSPFRGQSIPCSQNLKFVSFKVPKFSICIFRSPPFPIDCSAEPQQNTADVSKLYALSFPKLRSVIQTPLRAAIRPRAISDINWRVMCAGLTVVWSSPVRSGPVRSGFLVTRWNWWPAATVSFIGRSTKCAGCNGSASETRAFTWEFTTRFVSCICHKNRVHFIYCIFR
jgi:hypothetical protein